MRRIVTLVVLLHLFAVSAYAQKASPTVGMEGRIEFTSGGPPLLGRAADQKSKLVLRIASATNADGGTRYDIRYIGFVPGDYDLRDFLIHKDGTPATELPSFPVRIIGLLPAEHGGELQPEDLSPLAALGGYRTIAIAVGVLWILMLAALVTLGRRKKVVASAPQPSLPPTVAELMRPLVHRAAGGNLDVAGRAELERLMLLYWTDRLGLQALSSSDAIAKLKSDADAGRVLRTLEDWLHRPPGETAVDFNGLLAPYR